jgi:hypothetical protein
MTKQSRRREANMKMRTWILLAATAQIVALAGCVPAVMAPSVVATAGPGKLPADFATDHAACAAQANQQMAPVIQAANNQVAGTALQNLMTGTGNNAVDVNTQATAALQQQYDSNYSACMYAKGNNIPPYYMQPVYYAEPEPTYRTRRRVVHRHAPRTPTAAASSGAGQASASSFVVPTPTAGAPASGSGFVEPAPTASGSAPGASAQFAVPPAQH